MKKSNLGVFRSRGMILGTIFLTISMAKGIQSVAQAQDANELARQQMEAMKQMMEAQGMSAEEIQQIEGMYRQSMGPLVEAQVAHEAQAQADFEAENAELGKAVISLPDGKIELQVTECVPAAGGDFRIQAQGTYDNRSDKIWIRGESHYNRTVLQMFLKGSGEFDIEIRPMVRLNSGQFTWAGTANGGRGNQDIMVTVNCGTGS